MPNAGQPGPLRSVALVRTRLPLTWFLPSYRVIIGLELFDVKGANQNGFLQLQIAANKLFVFLRKQLTVAFRKSTSWQKARHVHSTSHIRASHIMHWQMSLKLTSAATYDDLPHKAYNYYSYLKIVAWKICKHWSHNAPEKTKYVCAKIFQGGLGLKTTWQAY